MRLSYKTVDKDDDLAKKCQLAGNLIFETMELNKIPITIFLGVCQQIFAKACMENGSTHEEYCEDIKSIAKSLSFVWDSE